MSGLAIRALLVALAVAGIVFSAVWLSDLHALNAANAAEFSPHPTTSRLESGLAQAKRARRLHPNSDPSIVEFGILSRLGRQAQARRVYEAVVRREPDNALAWLAIAIVTQRSDPAESARAIARVHQLNPLAGRGH
jgi:Tetratricopeptide repeat